MDKLSKRLLNYRHSFNPRKTQWQVVMELRKYGNGQVSETSYRKWEQGITEPKDHNLDKINKLLAKYGQ
jgi:hypothetical protein